ncbi:MAG: hypothetical protein CFE31_04950 [Rhizobiales bacterium PAR1]|nr:MAG: hypothetical protein CFE31_04950 [Rhizobiales bacterium PAR1]
MALFGKLFGKKPQRDEVALANIRQWVATALGDSAGLDLTISEIECPDPSCPGLETFILVMREGEATQAAKVRKPIAEITEADVAEAVQYL